MHWKVKKIGNRLRSTHCREFYLKLYRPTSFFRITRGKNIISSSWACVVTGLGVFQSNDTRQYFSYVSWHKKEFNYNILGFELYFWLIEFGIWTLEPCLSGYALDHRTPIHNVAKLTWLASLSPVTCLMASSGCGSTVHGGNKLSYRPCNTRTTVLKLKEYFSLL